MKLLMLSTDGRLFSPSSPVRERMRRYGEICEELHVVVYTKPGFEEEQLASNVRLYPTNSLVKAGYFFTAFRIGAALIRGRGITVMTVQDPFETGFVGYLLKGRFHIPLQLQIHTDFLNQYFKKQSFKNRVRAWCGKHLLLHADGIRVVSERIKKSIIADTTVMSTRISVLPVAVDVRVSSSAASEAVRTRYPQYQKLVLMVSRLAPEKNITLALDAFVEIQSQLPHAGLIIVGSGPEQAAIEQHIVKKGLTASVRIEPWTDDVAPYYKAADVYLLTSNYEGYGRTVIEALVAETPIVMTDVGIAGEVVVTGYTGIVVPVGDARAVAAAVIAVLARPRVEWRDYAVAAVASLPSRIQYLERFKKGLEDIEKRPVREARKLNVLFVVNDFGLGGVQRLVVDFANTFDQQRCIVTVATLLDRKDSHFFRHDLRTDVSSAKFAFKGFYDIASWITFYRFMRRSRFDVVFTQLFMADTIGRLVAFAARVPVLVTEIQNLIPALKKRYIVIDRMLAHITTACISTAPAITNYALRTIRFPRKKMYEISTNVVDAKRFDVPVDRSAVLKAIGVPTEAKVIIAVGRLMTQKGHAVLLDAMPLVHKSIPHAHAVIVGSGRLDQTLREKAHNLSIDAYVHFIGERRDIVQLLKSADVFAFPSLWEGQGLVLFDAIFAKLPIVASNTGGIPDAIEDNITGFLVPPGDAHALAQKLIEIIEHPEKGAQAARKAREKYGDRTLDHAVGNLESLFVRLYNAQLG